MSKWITLGEQWPEHISITKCVYISPDMLRQISLGFPGSGNWSDFPMSYSYLNGGTCGIVKMATKSLATKSSGV